VTEPQIRAEILLSLAELYEDILTRNQYKQFRFRGADNRLGEKILSGLKSHQIVIENGSSAVRLTDVGYKLIRDELPDVRPEALRGRAQFSEGNHLTLLPLDPEEIRRMHDEIGRVDFMAASRIIEGRFLIRWASAGFEELTGYTLQELEDAGGWPVLVGDPLKEENHREIINDLLSRLLAGEGIRGQIRIRTKKGSFRWLQCTTLPRWDSTGRRVIGSLSAVRDITQEQIDDC